MRLNELSPEVGSRIRAKACWPRPGSGLGRTAGRGFNGQKSRSGGSLHPGLKAARCLFSVVSRNVVQVTFA
jgi:large subunit ribosomal protein L15